MHGRLDRHYGLQLLEWGLDGKIADDISPDEQKKYIGALKNILSEDDYRRVAIYPAMRSAPKDGDKIFIPDSYFKYALPYALDKLKSKTLDFET